MSAESDMIAAANAAEVAVVQLAEAYTNYVNAYKVASTAVYAADTRQQATSELEHSVGAERLALNLAMRMIGLGLERLLRQPGMTPVGPEWVTKFTAQIEAHVPVIFVTSGGLMTVGSFLRSLESHD